MAAFCSVLHKGIYCALVIPIAFPKAERLLKLPIKIRVGTLVSPRVNQEVSTQPGGGRPAHVTLSFKLWFSHFILF